ncbi:MAG: radical SAM family heme chaperone HemW, partial [Hyphomicrobiaceae bacterium]
TPSDPGFGVYIHWPFCAAKCPYCDFNSHVRFGGIDEPRFLKAFLAELDHTASLTGPQTVSTIFFGGGTPSLMAPSTVGAILDHIAKLYPIAPNPEITLEANPGSVEAERFRGYREAGINRVSMGVQSLHDSELKKLGRIHTVDEAKAAIAIAAKTFDRYTFDLIYARPGQTVPEWRAELGEALSLAGSHLSLYQLSIEPETPFAKLHATGKLTVPDADTAAALYDLTQDMTVARGLPQYEISNHAAPGEESRHNLIYWRYGEYAGIGPGAHGRIVTSLSSDAYSSPSPLRGGPGWGSHRSRHATITQRNPEAWLSAVERNGHGLTELTLVTPTEQADEMLLMGLRLNEGLDLTRLAQLTGYIPSALAMADLEELGMIERAGNRHIRATANGRFILNALVAKLSQGFVQVAA